MQKSSGSPSPTAFHIPYCTKRQQDQPWMDETGSITPEPRVRQACEPCRKKKTKCPGEKPICSYCQRLQQRCTYIQRDGTGYGARQSRSRRDSKERLRRLETQIRNMDNAIQRLVGQRKEDPSPPQSRTSGTLPEAATELEEATPLQFDESICPNPPPEIWSHFVDTYNSKLHLQPLPLFENLSEDIPCFPGFLMHAFMATMLLFLEHPFYGDKKSVAIDFYVHSARKTAIDLASEGISSLGILQTICLLTVFDIAASKQGRAWMNISIASRLVMSLQPSGIDSVDLTTDEDIARCCWSVFILEKAFTSGPSMLQLDGVPFNSVKYPSSPPRPPGAVSSIAASPSSGNFKKSPSSDLGINAYCLQLFPIWHDVAAYLQQVRLGYTEDPWRASSTYNKLAENVYEFETGIAQMHRFRSVSFQTRSAEEFAEQKSYWIPWLLMQLTFHTSQALLNHPIFHIMVPRKPSSLLKPPSFLQHTVDQALLHSGWTVRLIRTCDDLNHQISDPFVGQLVAVAATVHWIFSFASDEPVAERAQSDFEYCHRFVRAMADIWPQLSQSVSRLDVLQSLMSHPGHDSIPSIKSHLLWDLLDPSSATNEPDLSSHSSIPPGQRVSTRYLVPLRESSDSRDTARVSDQSRYNDGTVFPYSTPALPDPLISDDFFEYMDIPDLSQVRGPSYFDFSGDL